MLHHDFLESEDKHFIKHTYPHLARYYEQQMAAYHRFAEVAASTREELSNLTDRDILALLLQFIKSQDETLGSLLKTEDLMDRKDEVARIFACLALGNGNL